RVRRWPCNLFLYGFYFGALGAERRGGGDELVGQEQLGRRDFGKRQSVDEIVLGQNADAFALDPLQRPGEILPAFVGLGEVDAGFVPGPVLEILEAGQGPVDARRADLEPVASLDRVDG